MADYVATRIVATGDPDQLADFSRRMLAGFKFNSILPQPKMRNGGCRPEAATFAIAAFLAENGVTSTTPEDDYPDPGRDLLQALGITWLRTETGYADKIKYRRDGTMAPAVRKAWNAHVRHVLKVTSATPERTDSTPYGRDLLANARAYGDMHYPNWNRRHWGCVRDVDPGLTTVVRKEDSTTVVLITEWTPPVHVVGALRTMYPGLKLDAAYASEDYGMYAGRIDASHGAAVQVPMSFGEPSVDLALSIWAMTPWS